MENIWDIRRARFFREERKKLETAFRVAVRQEELLARIAQAGGHASYDLLANLMGRQDDTGCWRSVFPDLLYLAEHGVITFDGRLAVLIPAPPKA